MLLHLGNFKMYVLQFPEFPASVHLKAATVERCFPKGLIFLTSEKMLRRIIPPCSLAHHCHGCRHVLRGMGKWKTSLHPSSSLVMPGNLRRSWRTSRTTSKGSILVTAIPAWPAWRTCFRIPWWVLLGQVGWYPVDPETSLTSTTPQPLLTVLLV